MIRFMKNMLMRSLGLIWVLVVGLAAAGAAAADTPTFRIESIRVEGASLASARVVRAESLLAPGHSYSEDGLRLAMRRIRRLPVVIDVDFRLERGSERGTYVLVIRVVETARFFYGVDLLAAASHGGWVLSSLDLDDLLDESSCPEGSCDSLKVLSTGVRQPVGAAGIGWAAIQARYPTGSLSDNPTAFELGYTQYDLFGTGAFSSARLAMSSNGQRKWYTFEAGIPIRGNHSLRLLVDGYQQNEDAVAYLVPDLNELGDTRRTRRLDATLEWRIDSRDDPLFPSDGHLLTAAVHFRDRDLPRSGSPFDPGSVNTSGRVMSFELAGTWYHPFDPRQSIWWGGGVSLYRGDQTGRYFYEGRYIDPTELHFDAATVRAEVGYQRSIWRPTGSTRLNDLRWQTTLSGLFGQSWLDEGFPDIQWRRLDLSTGLVLRNRWGVARFALIYRSRTETVR
ncbi:MAG: BamA/TamA family outer membrane protein [Acidobacteria bacterium]|nr:BamA/TamA family outer membrane protein [Acidobacteriota bacterium]